VLSEPHDVYREWKRLVLAYSVTGVKAHDARIVAAINVYSIPRILTFNTGDFAGYEILKLSNRSAYDRYDEREFKFQEGGFHGC